MVTSALPVQQTMTELSALCAGLARDCGQPAASLLFSSVGMDYLGGRIGIGFPSAERASALRPVASMAVVGNEGTVWGLLLLAGDDHALPHPDHLELLRLAADDAAACLDRLAVAALVFSAQATLAPLRRAF